MRKQNRSLLIVPAALAIAAAWTTFPQTVSARPLSPDAQRYEADEIAAAQRIAACTAVIESGADRGKDLAADYTNRAVGWIEQKYFDRALPDLDQAIKLNPNHALA